MKRLANFLLFQIGWTIAVAGAARGAIWLGPVVMAVVVGVHVGMVSDRARQLRYILLVGLFGTLADTLLASLGATSYPSSAPHWPFAFAPPWISALWIGFATLPRFSLAWLAQRPWLAALLGATGGPLSYFAGVRMGAVGVSADPLLTWASLAVEYSLATPLLLHFAPRSPAQDAVAHPTRHSG